MKRSAALFILFLAVFSSALFAQPGSGKKLISVDSTTLTFRQFDPRLYCNPSGGFRVTWKDMRNGPETSFGQDYDRNGNLTGKNYPMLYHDWLALGTNGGYFAMFGQDYTYEVIPSSYDYYLYARTVTPDSAASELFVVDWYSVSWCGTGAIGSEASIIAHNDGAYSVLYKREGSALLKKYSSQGTLLKSKTIYEMPATDLSTAIDKKGNYVVFFKLTDLSTWDQQNYPQRYIARFYNPADALVADGVTVFDDYVSSEMEFSSDRITTIAAVPVQDSLFEFLALDRNACAVQYSLFDLTGKKISEQQSVALQAQPPAGTAGTPKILNMNVSNMTSSGYSVVAVLEYKGPADSMRYYFSCLRFDTAGNVAEGPVQFLVTQDEASKFGTGIFRDEEGYIYTSVSMNDDIYLNKYSAAGKTVSVKINDDAPAANQVKTAVVPAGSKGYFVMWEEEGQLCGRYADKEANASGLVYHPANKSINFLPDGTASVCAYKRINADSSAVLGFYIYDEDFNISRNEQVIKISPSMDAYISSIKSVVFDDSSFAVAYSLRDKFYVQIRNRAGDLVKEVSGVPPELITAFELYRETDNTIAVKTNLMLQIFNKSLDSLSSFTIGNVYTYLRNGMSITGNNSSQPPFDYVFQLKSALSSYSSSFSTTRPVMGMQCGMLDSSRAIVIFWSMDRYYFQTFSLNGEVYLKNEMEICGNTGNETDMSFAVNGDNIMLAWAEAVNPGKGYDIYAGSMRIADVTEVKDGSMNDPEVPRDYSLKQNYPNPFNPVTRIEYSLPEESRVSLIVYDILGREVKRLVDAIESAGVHSAIFDASRLSSGIYIYTLLSDKGTKLTRKMIIMK